MNGGSSAISVRRRTIYPDQRSGPALGIGAITYRFPNTRAFRPRQTAPVGRGVRADSTTDEGERRRYARHSQRDGWYQVCSRHRRRVCSVGLPGQRARWLPREAARCARPCGTATHSSSRLRSFRARDVRRTAVTAARTDDKISTACVRSASRCPHSARIAAGARCANTRTGTSRRIGRDCMAGTTSLARIRILSYQS
jgi:hypothetical protein